MVFDALSAGQKVVWVIIPNDQYWRIFNEGCEVMFLTFGKIGDVWQDLNSKTVVEWNIWHVDFAQERLDNLSANCQSALQQSDFSPLR
jgi:hypothetical protein